MWSERWEVDEERILIFKMPPGTLPVCSSAAAVVQTADGSGVFENGGGELVSHKPRRK